MAILFIATIPFVGCKQTNKNEELTQISTRIKWFTYASYIGTYVAKDWGYFEKEGLDVTIYEGGPQVDATKLVAAGNNDFGICGGDQLIVARSKGLPVVAIAALMQESPAGFMVLDTSDITSMEDFPGHKIRIIPGHNTEIEYRAVMKKLGINTEESMDEMVNFTELQLLLNGDIDIEPIYLNNQPSKARDLGVEFRTFTPTDYGVRSYGNVYFTTEKMIEEKPEVVQSFLNAIIKGWSQAFETPEAAVDSLITHSEVLKKSVELDKLENTRPLMFRVDGRTGFMEKERWEDIYSDLLETNVIKDSVNISKLFDNRFIQNIYKQAQIEVEH
ncbi:ABC transporter substrate-binding protein [Aureisphaera galaxeae]|uniref:ABC transporter substrate-binding protein n=1 Tax=Aureisphaera galaxeae TaxID=1538023 RepID=UPI0023508625|nr:ABC transporter substrate-binding protein [Aureisphaera galaxeae]MDC8002840.1 ABC transporter substrate-binding protein [Aureisphaera galaxeae]